MPGGNGIKAFLIANCLLSGFLCGHASEHPLVIGYERFHNEEPSVEGGRILYNELGCVNCHGLDTGLPVRNGPILDGLFDRSHVTWIREFLKNPSSKKPGTTMPQMHLEDGEVEAVMHFLNSLPSKRKIAPAFRFVNPERGLALYHEIGCVACHAPSPEFLPAEGFPEQALFNYPNVPLPNLKEKYDISSLSAFLYNPHHFRPTGRMPKFVLDREDGGDIAAFLLDHTSGDSTDYPSLPEFQTQPTLVERGKAVVEARHCTACHEISNTADSPVFPIRHRPYPPTPTSKL